MALEAVKGQTVAQLDGRYEVHGQNQAWKKALVEGASGVLVQEQKAKNDAALVARLLLKVERDFLAERSG